MNEVLKHLPWVDDGFMDKFWSLVTFKATYMLKNLSLGIYMLNKIFPLYNETQNLHLKYPQCGALNVIMYIKFHFEMDDDGCKDKFWSFMTLKATYMLKNLSLDIYMLNKIVPLHTETQNYHLKYAQCGVLNVIMQLEFHFKKLC